jgi:CubicO group peptidase (beta-lactamase class C family)
MKSINRHIPQRYGRILGSLVPSLLMLLACTGLARAEDKARPVPEQIQSQLQELMQRYQVPGMAVARIGDGRLVWQAGLGRRNSTDPVTPETVFNVASLTKPLFASLVMQLVAEDELALDENLSQYWVDPDLAEDPRLQQLTPRILLSHQGGLPNWRGERKLAFMFAPGERHEYSGEGFEYLRRAIEKKTGRSLSELMQAQVLAPAGMSHTSMGWDPAMDDQLAGRFDQQAQLVEMGDKQRTANAAAAARHRCLRRSRRRSPARWRPRCREYGEHHRRSRTRSRASRRHPGRRLRWSCVREAPLGHKVSSPCQTVRLRARRRYCTRQTCRVPCRFRPHEWPAAPPGRLHSGKSRTRFPENPAR